MSAGSAPGPELEAFEDRARGHAYGATDASRRRLSVTATARTEYPPVPNGGPDSGASGIIVAVSNAGPGGGMVRLTRDQAGELLTTLSDQLDDLDMLPEHLR